ncbi:unnamed protein product [Oreochromis niloticus]|nr:unnamed protein product [Mustela putorius furo]
MCDPPPPPRAVVGECTNVPGGCRFNECLLENEKYKKESSRRICTFSQRGSLLNFDHFQILRAIGKGSFGKLEEELRLRPWRNPDYGRIFRGTRLALGWLSAIPGAAESPHLLLHLHPSRFRWEFSASLQMPTLQPRRRRSARRRLSCFLRPLPLPEGSGTHAAINWTLLTNLWWAARAQRTPAPVPVPRVREAGAQLVPALISRPAEALSVSAPVPAPRVRTAAAVPVTVPASMVRGAVNQSTPAPMPVPRVRSARIQPVSAPVPTPRVGAAVSGRPAPVPVSAEGSGEPTQQSSLCSRGYRLEALTSHLMENLESWSLLIFGPRAFQSVKTSSPPALPDDGLVPEHLQVNQPTTDQ